MADAKAQINQLVKPILRKIHSHLNEVNAQLEYPTDSGGSPSEPATYEYSEPVEKDFTEDIAVKYGKEIVDVETYEEFSELITEIASREGLSVNTDLDYVAKTANYLRQRHGLEAL